MWPKLLLLCGIVAPLLFVGTNVLGGVLWSGYNFTNQSISDLSASGAPTRAAVVPPLIAVDLLLMVFGVGVWGVASRNGALRVVAGLLVVYGVVNAAAEFFPNRLGETPRPLSPGVILTATGVISLLVAIGFGAAAYRNWFRFYSIGTLLVFAVLTVLGLLQARARVGVQERVLSFGSLLWVAMLAVVLLSAEPGTGRGAGVADG
jgi:hypothetical protein